MSLLASVHADKENLAPASFASLPSILSPSSVPLKKLGPKKARPALRSLSLPAASPPFPGPRAPSAACAFADAPLEPPSPEEGADEDLPVLAFGKLDMSQGSTPAKVSRAPGWSGLPFSQLTHAPPKLARRRRSGEKGEKKKTKEKKKETKGLGGFSLGRLGGEGGGAGAAFSTLNSLR